MSYYPNLRYLRENKDLTQEQVAKIIYTTQKQYSRWETGQYDLPFDIAIKLAQFYNISLDYIAGLTNEKIKLNERKK